MPTFDAVSEIDKHELSNAIDQANKEVTGRFDFKGTDSKFELKENTISVSSESEFQLDQMYDILTNKLTKRGIDILCLERNDADIQLKTARQTVVVREGLEAGLSKKIVKVIKDSKMKVQAAIQGDSVRVTGKKRDDLQQVMELLRNADSLEMPLQFKNFRD
jgi:uncharacterized protein YajQ (UPF0234 family)